MLVMIMNYRLTYMNQYYSTSSDLSKSCEIRCQERNLWGSLSETFRKSIQIFTCQQNLERRNTRVKQPYVHITHHYGCSVSECEARLPVRGRAHPLKCVYSPQKEREEEAVKKKKERERKQQQEILLTCSLLNRSPLLLFLFLFPRPWSSNPNGKRLFHVGTWGALAAFFPGLRLNRNTPHTIVFHHLKAIHANIYPSKPISPLISC